MTWWHGGDMFMNAAYLTSVPVHPFTLYILVVICNPYLGVIVLTQHCWASFGWASKSSKNVTLRCCASWFFISTIHSSIFMCSLGEKCSNREKWTHLLRFPNSLFVSWRTWRLREKDKAKDRGKRPKTDKAKDRWKDKAKAKTHRAERKRTIESNFSLWLNWAASPDSFVHTWTLSGSNWAFAFRAFWDTFAFRV